MTAQRLVSEIDAKFAIDHPLAPNPEAGATCPEAGAMYDSYGGLVASCRLSSFG